MSARLAIAFCAHHKPWLMMSTLVTALAQDYQDADFHVVYNVGDGAAAEAGAPNAQLSPFDERVREVCQLHRDRVFEVEYQNDAALDSGAWYKFIRDGHWKAYDAVLFVGEGTLFARRTTLSAMLDLVASRGVHVIASGHEKRRIPKNRFFNYNQCRADATAADRYHDDMIRETFCIFGRDPSFRSLLDAWKSDFQPETQCHVPSAGPLSPGARRVRSAWSRRLGEPTAGTLPQLPWWIDYAVARSRVALSLAASRPAGDEVYVNGALRPMASVARLERIRDVGFHREPAPEWFGCATNHLMTRTFLERFTAKLDEFRMWDALEVPFAGTALEVIWGFLPAWLGFDKWFTDGFHRVRKECVTYRREDYPPQMAAYINRYYSGDLAVRWRGDYLKVGALGRGLEHLRDELPAPYF